MSDAGRRRRNARSVPPTRLLPRLPEPGEPRQLRLRLRTKLVVAMAFAALVPVVIVALLATGVILSSLENSLREEADRQLSVGLNLILRAIERLGDETIQLAESSDLPTAFEQPALDAWLAHQAPHVPSSRLQLLDPTGRVVFDRVVGGAEARFKNLGVAADEPAVVNGRAWGRGVALVAVEDRVVVRAVSPIVDAALALRGVLVLSMPLDADFADGIKGALSADVLLGGPSGRLETTFRGANGGRSPAVRLGLNDRMTALRGGHVMRNLDIAGAQYKIAATALLDHKNQSIGLVGVAVDREPLAATKRLAVRSLFVGGLAALAFALVLALFWSRRLGAPIAELHHGAIAVSRGDLDHRIEIPGGDELTELAAAFNQMTATLQDNQQRLAARMREIVALHDAGRAVSSVIDMASVSRKIVDAVARTFDVQLAALWLGDASGGLRAIAARARRTDDAFASDEALPAAEALRSTAERVWAERRPVRRTGTTVIVQADEAGSAGRGSAAEWQRGVVDDHEASASMKIRGPVVALPLDRKTRMVGVLAVARAVGARAFSEADLNLLTTFADQAGAALENALLYSEVRGASEELERKVQLRTTELTEMNRELGRTLNELRGAQAQLLLSERMAGLGLLVAGVAHEINSPTAAIRGSIDGLPSGLSRVAHHGVSLAAASVPAPVIAQLEVLAPALAERSMPTGLVARKAAREIAGALEALPGPLVAPLPVIAAELADLGTMPDEAAHLIELLGSARALAPRVVAALTDHVYLHRTASTVRHAIGSIQRIVGALKSYSHLDQQPVRTDADVHEGIETTLTLLQYALRDIVIERRYGSVPAVPVFVDELNQVWTNLIQNAQQALTYRSGDGGKITIETAEEGPWAVVRVTDNGTGIPADVLPKIFDPFFTTKAKGEGTGLGLGIARQIVEKHGGTIRCESAPGWTMFEVKLPIHLAGGAA